MSDDGILFKTAMICGTVIICVLMVLSFTLGDGCESPGSKVRIMQLQADARSNLLNGLLEAQKDGLIGEETFAALSAQVLRDEQNAEPETDAEEKP